MGWELIAYYDEARGISAMMQTTGYSLSITGQMQARGEIKPAGVHTPDECVPADKYISELDKRGVHIRGDEILTAGCRLLAVGLQGH